MEFLPLAALALAVDGNTCSNSRSDSQQLFLIRMTTDPQKSRGRPKIKDSERRKKFTLTVSAANYAAAKLAGMPVSEMLDKAIERRIARERRGA